MSVANGQAPTKLTEISRSAESRNVCPLRLAEVRA
jgi:hypothetical protein